MNNKHISVLNPDTMERVLNYLDVHFDKLDKIIENTKSEIDRTEYHRFADQDVCVGGQFVHEIPGRQGFDRLLESGVVVGLGGATSSIGLFLDYASTLTMVAIQNNVAALSNFSTIGLTTDGFAVNLNCGPSGIYVPAASKLFVFGTGWDSVSPVALNVQQRFFPRAQYDRNLKHIIQGDA